MPACRCRPASRSRPRSARSTTKKRPRCRTAIEREIAEHVKKLEKAVGRDAGIDREPAARLGPFRREVLDARHDGHDSQSRPQRRRRRRPEAADRQRPLRVRQLSPLHPDVRQRRARDSEGRVRARVRGRQEGARREDRHRSRRSRAARGRRALQGRRPEEERQGLSAGSARAADDGAQRGVPLVDERRARSSTAASTTFPITSARPSTCR